MTGSWNDWVTGGYMGLGFWAVFYLLGKVRNLELQIRVLKNEDKRLHEIIDALYILLERRK